MREAGKRENSEEENTFIKIIKSFLGEKKTHNEVRAPS